MQFAGKKIADKCVGNYKKLHVTAVSSSQAMSFKLGECNLLPSILMLQFTNCVKFDFAKSYLPWDSHTNTAISDCFAYPSRWGVHALVRVNALNCHWTRHLTLSVPPTLLRTIKG